MDTKNFFRLAPALERFRKQRGVSQKAAALAAGIDATRLSALERGRVVGPGKDFIERLIRTIEMTPDEAGHLAELAARDRVMREVIRNFPSAAHAFLDAALDAAQVLAAEDVAEAERGLRQMVQAKARLQAFVAKD